MTTTLQDHTDAQLADLLARLLAQWGNRPLHPSRQVALVDLAARIADEAAARFAADADARSERHRRLHRLADDDEGSDD